MAEKDCGPAFPAAYDRSENGRGMSLRDWFAGMALQGLLAGDTDGAPCNDQSPEAVERVRKQYAKDMARSADRYADAMLAERKDR